MTLSPLRLRLLVAALLTVSFLGALDHTVVSTSLATIAGELDALEHMSWIIVGYTLASTVLMPIIGKLGDVLGPRIVFLTSLVVFLAASFACGLAPSIEWLVAARIVKGMSSAGLQLMSQTIIARVAAPRERPKYMALIGAAFPIAILIGPVLGGLITDYWGWRWVFWINLPFGLVACLLAVVAIPHIAGVAKVRLDALGAATLTAGLVGVVLGVTWIGDPGTRTAAITAFAAALMGFVGFLAAERRAVEPIVPLRLFADRTVSAGTALSAIIGIGLFSITAYLPTYIQMAYRTTATVSGLVPIATVLGMLVSNLLSGFLVSRTGHYRVYPIAGTILGAVGLAVMASLPVGLPLWVPMVVMFFVGLGTGGFMSLVVAVVQSAVPPLQVGSVTATVNLVRQIGSTVATAIVGGAIGLGVVAMLPPGVDAARLTPEAVRQATPQLQTQVAEIYHDIFAPVFLALAIVYALGIVAAVLLPHRELSEESEPVTSPNARTT